MQIGRHQLANNLFLAPMAGVTDRLFRKLCRDLGAGMAVSEMVGSVSLLRGSPKTWRRANQEGEASPRAVQIVGAVPAMLAECARVNEAHGAEIIDINMGCPAKKVCNMLSGSALLRDERLVKEILETVVAAVNIPVTLKIRTGWDQQSKNGVTIAKIAEASGIQALAVHGRTRACLFGGSAEYETIAAIKASVNIPVIANGDINTPEKAAEVLRLTKADGIMIGRAAQGRPWIFREIAHYLATNEVYPEPSISEVKQILLKHLDALYDFYGEETGARIARKHVSWYTKGLSGSAKFRDAFNRIEDPRAQLDAIEQFFLNADLHYS